MLNSKLLEKLHRTWVQALINDYWNDYAAIIVDAELSFEEKYDQYVGDYISGLLVYLPLNLYSLVTKEEETQEVFRHPKCVHCSWSHLG